MKRFNILFLFMFLFVLIFTGTFLSGRANAIGMQSMHSMRHKCPGRNKKTMRMMGMFNIFKLKKELNLTKKQIKQVILIKKQEFKAFRLNMNSLRNPMLSALKSGNFDKNVFVSDIMHNVKNMAEIKANFFTKFFKVLTLKQRNRFIFIMNKKLKNRIKRLEFMKRMLNKRIKNMKKNLSE